MSTLKRLVRNRSACRRGEPGDVTALEKDELDGVRLLGPHGNGLGSQDRPLRGRPHTRMDPKNLFTNSQIHPGGRVSPEVRFSCSLNRKHHPAGRETYTRRLR